MVHNKMQLRSDGLDKYIANTNAKIVSFSDLVSDMMQIDKLIFSNDKFPPMDIVHFEKDRKLILRFALSGYKKEDISISTSEYPVYHILVKTKDTYKSIDEKFGETTPDFFYQEKRISQRRFQVATKLDPSLKFDSVKMEDGILEITFIEDKEKTKLHEIQID